MPPLTRDILVARRHLLETGEVPEGLTHPLVARSWRRCAANGLSPQGPSEEIPLLSASQLARAVEQHRELIAHARPAMEYLYGQTRGSGHVVVLSDDRGVLLQALGDAEFLDRAERVALSPGANWAEELRGTNAIGTALAESSAVVVHGQEHFLERNGFLTCSAAPVVAPDGRLLGVLDISGDHREHHPHTFGLVQTAAQMIENRLFDSRFATALRLRFHPHAEGVGTLAEGVLALNEEGRVIGANRTALQLLKLECTHIGQCRIQQVFDQSLPAIVDWSRRALGTPMALYDHHGRRFYVRVEAALRPVISMARRPLPDDALAAIDTGDTQLSLAIKRARKVLGKAIPLLLRGESGVGKEVFARALHNSGPRRTGPFVPVNCAALPEPLIESELFGYMPGAFTGARRDGSPGCIREAHGGTLFLDEIGDMPLALQARLLRVLQERQVTPLGSGKPVAVDFELVCATHCDLKRAMAEGQFREDLYYRINGLTLTLPPLRERGDLPLLLARLLAELSKRDDLHLAPALAEAFARHPWPGNIRQLANTLRTAVALLDEGEWCIDWHHLADDLSDELRHPNEGDGVVHSDDLRAQSDAAIARVLADAEGNRSEAARRLGVSRSTLYRRLRQQER